MSFYAEPLSDCPICKGSGLRANSPYQPKHERAVCNCVKRMRIRVCQCGGLMRPHLPLELEDWTRPDCHICDRCRRHEDSVTGQVLEQY